MSRKTFSETFAPIKQFVLSAVGALSKTFSPKPAEIVSDTSFANPKLAEIAESFQVKRGRSRWYSLILNVFAFLTIVLGVFVLFPGLVVIFYLPVLIVKVVLIAFEIEPDNFEIVMLLTISLFVYYLCYIIIAKWFFYLRRAARMSRIDAYTQLSSRTEDPVLYLRSFAHDASGNPFSRTQKTYEEDLALVLSAFGPVIAVGNPDEIESPLGAARIYLKNENWQENVRRLMQISQLVIIQAGNTQGVIWELEAALENNHPQKVIMSFLSWLHLDEEERERQYLQFRINVHEYLKRSPSPVTIKLPKKIENAAFITFSDGWTHEPVKLNLWKKRLYRFSSSLLVTEAVLPVLIKRRLKARRWKKIPYHIFIFWLIFGVPWTILRQLKYLTFENTRFIETVDYVCAVAVVLIIFWTVPNLFNRILQFFYPKLANLFRRLKTGLQEAE